MLDRKYNFKRNMDTWPPARVETLEMLWADGWSATQIAGELGDGITRNAVLGKIHRMGLSGRDKTTGKMPKARKHRGPRARRKKSEIIYNRFAGPICEADPVEIKDEDIPVEQRKKLQELTGETCRWPVGDPSSPEFYFCGAMPELFKPYCSHHCTIAYHPPREPRPQGKRAPNSVVSSIIPARSFAA